MDKTINHFEILTTRKTKTEFLFNKEQFISFLKRGFLNDKNQPVQKIKLSLAKRV